MPKDATLEIMAGLDGDRTANFRHINTPVYNIDDMDSKACMADLRFSG